LAEGPDLTLTGFPQPKANRQSKYKEIQNITSSKLKNKAGADNPHPLLRILTLILRTIKV